MLDPKFLSDLTTDILEASLATILGIGAYTIFTHPKYQKKRVPKIKAGRLQVLPNLKIKLKNQTIHLHHWILLSAILGFLNHMAHGLDNFIFVKFFTLGGIIQGLTYKDRFRIFLGRQGISSEKNKTAGIRIKFAYAIAALVMVFVFLTIPISPAHAKVAPTTKKIRHSITTTVSKGETYVKKRLQRHKPTASVNVYLY